VPADISITPTDICVAWTAQAGTTYYVQGTVDIAPGSWSNLSTNVAAQTAMSVCFPKSVPFRFFRVAVASAGTGGNGGSVTPTPVAVELSQPTLLPDGSLQLQWPATIGKVYRVESSADLVAPTWIALTNISATKSPMTFDAPKPSAGSEVRFYRIIAP
jgi:hypothetical protein